MGHPSREGYTVCTDKPRAVDILFPGAASKKEARPIPMQSTYTRAGSGEYKLTAASGHC